MDACTDALICVWYVCISCPSAGTYVRTLAGRCVWMYYVCDVCVYMCLCMYACMCRGTVYHSMLGFVMVCDALAWHGMGRHHGTEREGTGTLCMAWHGMVMYGTICETQIGSVHLIALVDMSRIVRTLARLDDRSGTAEK